jgi:hypothetical protein
MPIYLVAAIKKHTKNSLGFFELCIQAFKGPYDHVEIAFVRNHKVYACHVTKYSKHVLFGSRDYGEFKIKYHLHFYRLDVFTPAREYELEARCRRMAVQPKRFSWYMEMMSAFPYPDITLAAMVFPFVEVGEKLDVNDVHGSNPSRYTFCGALCAEILGIEGPTKMTATDIVHECILHFKAILETEDPLPREPQSLTDPAGIVRNHQGEGV